MKSSPADDRITLEETREAIGRSGYLLEQRAKAVLERGGYSVELNSSYPGRESGVSREFDIWAARPFPLFPGEFGSVGPVLICECKSNSQPVVFFETKFSEENAWRFCEDIKCSGVPVKIWVIDAYRYLPTYLGLQPLHHYTRGPFSTQYCNFHRKDTKAVWQARHDEQHHQAFTTIVDALEASINLHYSLMKPPRGQVFIPEIRMY
jgi:hypothetical protein